MQTSTVWLRFQRLFEDPARFVLQDGQAAVAMRVCSRQASAEFALFSRLRAARGTTHRQRFLLCDFHAYTMHGCSPTRWSIVTIAESSVRRIIILESVWPALEFWRQWMIAVPA